MRKVKLQQGVAMRKIRAKNTFYIHSMEGRVYQAETDEYKTKTNRRIKRIVNTSQASHSLSPSSRFVSESGFIENESEEKFELIREVANQPPQSDSMKGERGDCVSAINVMNTN